MRAYSSRVTPCSAAISGVTRISVLAVAMFAPSCAGRSNAAPLENKFPGPGSSSCGLCGANERFDHGAEYYETLGGTECRFHGAFGMGHEAGDVAFTIANAGDVGHRAVGIASGVSFFLGGRRAGDAIRRGVAEDDLAILFEFGERRIVNSVISVVMRDGNFQDLTLLGSRREGCVGLLDTNVDMAANVAQTCIAHHGTGKQAGFEKNLEAIANSQHEAATLSKSFDRLHYWREPRNRSGPKVITVGESTGQDKGVTIR